MKQRVLLTPGPLTTTMSVKESMMYDLGTRDGEYQQIVIDIQAKLLTLAHANEETHACILLQGSGTYGVESVLTSTIAPHENVLILSNGAYGERMSLICEKAGVPYVRFDYSMTKALPLQDIEQQIAREDITHVAYIHSETTAGVLNNIVEIQKMIKKYNKISIVDAMSSFGGITLSLQELNIDYLITSSNKCLHGVPGIAIIFANKAHLLTCKNTCKSLSLDLYDQYTYMIKNPGSFRFTSPTHVILALHQAIEELLCQGGIKNRMERYYHIQQELYEAMHTQGFETLVDKCEQSPIITTYVIPSGFDFQAFYDYYKENGFLLYSGKLPGIDAFRIGNIGAITDDNVHQFKILLKSYKERNYENR